MKSIDLHEVVMEGMLSMLLFAGALHVDVRLLRSYRAQVLSLAVVGTLLSTVIVGYASSYVLNALGLELPFIYCLAFGALISPTDPIAVLGVLKAAKVPKVVETAIAGESLFNDGVAVVVMTLLLGIIEQGSEPSVKDALSLFAHEALGGVAYGAVLGFVLPNAEAGRRLPGRSADHARNRARRLRTRAPLGRFRSARDGGVRPDHG